MNQGMRHLARTLLTSAFGVALILAATRSVQARPAPPPRSLKQYVAQLQKRPSDLALRKKIIALARQMKPAPQISAEAKGLLDRGVAALKAAKSAEDFRGAATQLEKAALAAPWAATCYLNLGLAQEKAGRPLRASQSFELYLLAAPHAGNAQTVQALVISNPQAALAQYVADLQKTPTDQALREKIIGLALDMNPRPGVGEEARRFLDSGAAAFKAAQHAADFQTAAVEFEQAALAAPWAPACYYNLGLAQDRAGRPLQASQSFRLYLLAAPNAEDAEAVRKLVINDPHEALVKYVADLQKDPKDQALRERIIALALTMNPLPAVPEEAKSCQAAGKGMMDQYGDYGGAVVQFERAALVAPWVAAYYHDLGSAQEKMGRPLTASRSYEWYLRASPNATDAETVRALIITDPQGTLARYVSDLGRNQADRPLRGKIIALVLEMDSPPPVPEEAKRFADRGMAAVQGAASAEDFKAAAAEFEKASLTAPWLASIYSNLGVVQDKAGLYTEAISSLNLYLLAAPNAPDAEATRSLIHQIEYRKEKAAKDAAEKAAREAAERAAREEAERLNSFVGNWRVTYFEMKGEASSNYAGTVVSISKRGDFYSADGPDWFFERARLALSGRTLSATVSPSAQDLTDMFDTTPENVRQQALGNFQYQGTMTLSSDGKTVYAEHDGWSIMYMKGGGLLFPTYEYNSVKRWPEGFKWTLERR